MSEQLEFAFMHEEETVITNEIIDDLVANPLGYEDTLREQNRALSERMLKHYACSCSLAMIIDTICHSHYDLEPDDALVIQAKRRLAEVADLEQDPFFNAFAHKPGRGE